MLWRRAAARFKDTRKTVQVIARVRSGLLHAEAHAWLSTQVDDVIGFQVSHEPGKLLRVGKIGLEKAKVLYRAELFDARTLQSDVFFFADHAAAENFAA